MEWQLNLLRQSNANPKISTYAHLYGPHNYNSLPFVPLGMEAFVHDKPNRCKTYAQHSSKGWVIGASTEHCRCWKIWSTATRTICIAATVFFKHKYLTSPSTSPTDALIAAAANLSHVIQHNAKAQHIGAKILQDLQRLQQLFNETAKQQLNPPAPPAQSRAPPPRVPAPTPLPTLPVVSDDEDSDDELESPPRVPTHRAVPLVHMHNLQQHHQLSTHTAAPGPLCTKLCYTSCPHITIVSLPPTLHNNVIQPTCSMQSSMTRWDVTYGRIVANFCPEKDDPYGIRLTVGGNRINFPGDCGTPTADMITVKILLNSVISTKNAKFMTIDIKDFYLNTPMARPECMRLKLSDIPTNIIELYKLRDIAHDGYVFVRIQKGIRE
eukprot:CCRYP_014220-RA/>CCRYP_014220-RA protein AED:0.34 eAED:0.40 QI:0/0/0/1/1/1/2/0/380